MKHQLLSTVKAEKCLTEVKGACREGKPRYLPPSPDLKNRKPMLESDL
jgi:hypothetical protein